MKNSTNKITREARLVVAFMSLAFTVLLWAIYTNATLGDAYGALVLAIACAFISGVSVFIITSELRDIQSRKTRAMLNKFHTQQVNELSSAIVKLETDNARQARQSFDIIAELANEIDGLRASVAQKENALANTRAMRDKNATQANELRAELEKIKEQMTVKHREEVMGIREALDYGDDYTYSASTALLLGTLDQGEIVRGETRYPLRNK